MKFSKYILILMIICSSAGILRSQSLEFVRSDVDSSRSRFVTATYIFGIDIVAEGVENCINVTFELRYNQTRFVRFSEWKAGNFGPTTKAYVLPLIDEANDFGRIVVSCGLDNMRDTLLPNSPKVVNLKFSVIPAAPHFETVNFTVHNPRATVLRDGAAEIIDLEAETITYTIHSYVNVYPGDADNNGIVDHLDFATISYYMGLGPNTKQMRSFKRDPASTLWGPQAVIAWDTAAATYADTDGNGEVNMLDNLIVTYNYDKSHPVSGIPSVQSLLYVPNSPVRRTRYSVNIPVYADTWQSYLAATGLIEYDYFKDYNFLGIEPAELFDDNDLAFAFSVPTDRGIEFIAGTVDRSNAASGSGVIAYLVVEPKNIDSYVAAPEIMEMKGISTGGNIFDMNAFTSVLDENSSDFSAEWRNNFLHINMPEISNDAYIEIFDITGEAVFKTNTFVDKSIVLPMNDLAKAVYLIKIITNGKVYTDTFLVY